MSPAPPPPPPKRPYLLRAMHQWMSDSGHTPHVIVDAERAGAEVPKVVVTAGTVVSNHSPSATQRLKLGNEEIGVDVRIGADVHDVPSHGTAVMGIYARETGE